MLPKYVENMMIYMCYLWHWQSASHQVLWINVFDNMSGYFMCHSFLKHRLLLSCIPKIETICGTCLITATLCFSSHALVFIMHWPMSSLELIMLLLLGKLITFIHQIYGHQDSTELILKFKSFPWTNFFYYCPIRQSSIGESCLETQKLPEKQ